MVKKWTKINGDVISLENIKSLSNVKDSMFTIYFYDETEYDVKFSEEILYNSEFTDEMLNQKMNIVKSKLEKLLTGGESIKELVKIV